MLKLDAARSDVISIQEGRRHVSRAGNSPSLDGNASHGRAMLPRVKIEGLCKSFNGTPVLIDVDLEVVPKEVVVILGPSGAGKSTLCRAINRLETIDSGQISIDGVQLPDGGKALA